MLVYEPPQELAMPCNPSPCGANTICKERNGAGSCSCIPEYFGDPYTGCRPECISNSDCENINACVNNKCRDPCPGVCGRNAECFVVNHKPSCVCISGYTGNPSTACREIPKCNIIFLFCYCANFESTFSLVDYLPPSDPCSPSPCGPYSECKTLDNHAVCSCQRNYIGIPPACHPECAVSSDCTQDKACTNQKCVDPCPAICGVNARCQVINHNPICSCPPHFVGDPFVRCILEQSKIVRASKEFFHIHS